MQTKSCYLRVSNSKIIFDLEQPRKQRKGQIKEIIWLEISEIRLIHSLCLTFLFAVFAKYKCQFLFSTSLEDPDLPSMVLVSEDLAREIKNSGDTCFFLCFSLFLSFYGNKQMSALTYN